MAKNKNRDSVLGSFADLGKIYGVAVPQEKEADKSSSANKTAQNCFINPYTFVPIPSGKDAAPHREAVARGNLTGVLECSLNVLAPVFIPNTTRAFTEMVKNGKKDVEHSFYEFYSYDDLNVKGKGAPEKPVIPGSELRGMIRSIYEQLTNSCFLHVDETNFPYKRTPQPKNKAVMIYKNSQWQLFYNLDMKKGDYKVFPLDAAWGMKQGERCTVQNGRLEKAADGDYILHLTGSFNIKKKVIVFRREQKGKSEAVSADAYLRLQRVLKSYADEKVNKKGDRLIYEQYASRLDNKDPVFVYTDDDRQYLSPSCITKEYFQNTIDSILKKQGKHDRCVDAKNCCPACRLFGMIGDEGCVAGRLRFTDSYHHEGLMFAPETVLPILGSPRISATEFYLKRPDPGNNHKANDVKLWNYDYWLNYEKKRVNGSTTILYKRTACCPELRGRKVYWHGAFKGKTDRSIAKSNMNCSVRPLTAGRFSFRVFFEDVSEEELKKLIFALTLNSKGIHKIGKGKPIGMGDVQISIDWAKSFYHEYQQQNGRIVAVDRKIAVSDTGEEFTLTENTVIRQILAYTKPLSEEEKALVDYPSTPAPNSKTYQWFGANRGTSIREPHIIEVLPKITDAKTLPKQPVD